MEHERLLPIFGLLLAGALAASGCSSSALGHESGEQCIDNKDNDDDGAVDCLDSDCAGLAVCSTPRDGAPPTDVFIPPPRDGQPADFRVDFAVPDLPTPQSSYGERCAFTGVVTRCPDGETVCVLSNFSNDGYCTFPCSSTCPDGPSGTRAECLYTFNGVGYCLFVCDFLGSTYSCPGGLACTGMYVDQKECWP